MVIQDSTAEGLYLEDNVNVRPSTLPTVSQSLHVSDPASFIEPQGILPTHDQHTEHITAAIPSIHFTSLDGESWRSMDLDMDGVPLDSPSRNQEPARPLVSPAMQLLSRQVKSFRIFLDICSGATRPLSRALLELQADVISFDILLDRRMDLLTDTSYEALLKLCASGSVAYGAASPSCSQYSRLKLRNDPGPPPLRTPEFLQGVPGLSASDLAKVQESFTTLSRCLTCLSVIHSSGGHVHLEQPSSAMSWLEPETQLFLRSIGHHCVNLAACHFGRSWRKNWLFASSFPTLTQLGCTCPRPAGSHDQVAGRTNQAGDFLSRDTACYPDLASRFAKLVKPLLSGHTGDVQWSNRTHIIPFKHRESFPHSWEDGGGIRSQPDWSKPDRSIPFRIKERFLQSNGQPLDWSIREHQPMRQMLRSISQIMGDDDASLFPSLLEGVSAGFLGDIPPSGIFPPNEFDDTDNSPLSIHFTNWNSAEDNPELTRELVQEEIDRGWVYEFPGTAADAQEAFPCGLALGRLGIAISEQRPPRLVVDNSVAKFLNGVLCLRPKK